MLTFEILILLTIICCIDFGFSESGKGLRFGLAKEKTVVVDDCLSHILSSDVTPEDEVVVIFSEMEDVNRQWTQEPTVVMSEANNTGTRYNLRKRDILYVFSHHPLADILETISWSSTTKFVVANRNGSAEKILGEFWKRRIVDVVLLETQFPSKFVKVFTYFPYSDNHCEHLGKVVPLGKCHEIVDIFPSKVDNLHGCPLIITLVERSPAVINSDGIPDGVETNILNMIAKSVNATPSFYFLKGRLRFYRTNGNSILLELLENHSHMVAGSLIYTESMHLMSEGIEYPVSMCMTVVVPRVTRPTYIHFFKNIIPGKILAALVANVALGTACIYSFLKIFDPRTTLKISARPVIHSPYLTIRIFLALWLLASFLLDIVFEASVSSSVLAPKALPQMESLEDVFKRDLLLDGNSFMMKEVLGSYLPRRRKNEICGCTLKKALTLIAEEGDRAYIDIKFNVMYNLMELPGISSKIYIPEKCILTFRPVIQLKKHSPFLHPVRKFMLSLSESGIIEKSFDTYNRKITEKRNVLRKGLKSLTVHDFKPTFLLLFLGFAASTLTFLIEYLAFNYFQIIAHNILIKLF